MKYRKNNYCFFFNQVYDFVWKPFNKVLSRLFVFNWMNFRVSLDKVDSCVNLQEKVISQAYPAVLIPRKYLL